MWKALHTVLNGTGFRKAEWAVSSRGDSTLMTFAQLAWELDGQPVKGLTTAQSGLIYAGRISAVAIIYPVPSKCDPDGSAFCNRGIPFPVDIVDIFRLPRDIPPIVDQAIEIGAKAVWMQLRLVNIPAAEAAQAAGLIAIVDKCIKMEHGRYGGMLHWAGMNTEVISARRRAFSR
jgi:hypothetical protein